MSYTESVTQTYTIADIGKVIDCFAADLDMTSQSTGLLSRDLVKQYAADVKAMAQAGYLVEANIVLKDSAGKIIRAAKYEVSTDAASLRSPLNCPTTYTANEKRAESSGVVNDENSKATAINNDSSRKIR